MIRVVVTILLIALLYSCGQNKSAEQNKVDERDSALVTSDPIDPDLLRAIDRFTAAYDSMDFDLVVAYLYKPPAGELADRMYEAINTELMRTEVNRAWLDTLFPPFVIGKSHYAKARIKMDVTITLKQREGNTHEMMLEDLEKTAGIVESL